MGETVTDNPSFLCSLANNRQEGYFLDPKTWGTYLHGIFDNEVVVNYILQQAGIKKQVKLTDYKDFKEEQYNKLARIVRENVDMKGIYEVLK